MESVEGVEIWVDFLLSEDVLGLRGMTWFLEWKVTGANARTWLGPSGLPVCLLYSKDHLMRTVMRGSALWASLYDL